MRSLELSWDGIRPKHGILLGRMSTGIGIRNQIILVASVKRRRALLASNPIDWGLVRQLYDQMVTPFWRNRRFASIALAQSQC